MKLKKISINAEDVCFSSDLNFLKFLISQIMIKEEDRLAAVISDIDHDVRIVPRGAYIKSPTSQVYDNRSFEGGCCFGF